MDNKIIVTSDKAKTKAKTIQINPEFLKLNGNLRKNTTLKRERKQKPIQNVDTNPSQIKKKLIEKIQAFKNKAVMQENRVQEKRVQENRVQENRVQENRVQENRVQEKRAQEKQSEEDKERDKFNNEFNKSLDFLQSLSNKRKENKEQHKVQNKVQHKVQNQMQNKIQHKVQNKAHNNTLKHGKIERTIHNEVINDILETELPPELSNTFRYPPQKNINFFENIDPIALEPTALEPTALEPTALEPTALEPILTEPILIEPILTEPIALNPIALPIKPINTSEPAYSNLKNGSRPTFREWKNQTVKNHHLPKHKKLQIMDQEPITQESITQEPITQQPMQRESMQRESMRSESISQKTALQELKEFIQKPIIEEKKTTIPKATLQEKIIETEQPINRIQSIKKITTRTLKYKLGKRGKKVGVLIKNAKTRKIIQREYALLKQKQISDIKNYLRSKNLLKIGSDAPNDVLRQMYEQAILSGEVENKAGETLIHNFMHS